MSDDLLGYYNAELRFLREELRQFADRHEGAADLLGLRQASSDPHVERLIEGVAALNARTRLKIEDDFPELVEGLLAMVAPQATLPVPPLAVIEATLPPTLRDSPEGIFLERNSLLESDIPQGDTVPLTFRTAAATRVWPVEIAAASLELPPFDRLPEVPWARDARAVVRLRLVSQSSQLNLGSLGTPSQDGGQIVPIDGLRLYLTGQAPEIHQLHELLLANCVAISLGAPGARTAHASPSRGLLRAPGFEEDENLLPNPPRAFVGYRLLTEYFCFPEKFLFLDFSWPGSVWGRLGREAELILYLNRAIPALVPRIDRRTFRLGGVPVINLFPLTADSVPVTPTSPEHLIRPDARNPLAHEIYSIERVFSMDGAGNIRNFAPFYSLRHADRDKRSEPPRFWHAMRRPSLGGGPEREQGTDVYLTLCDLGFVPASRKEARLNVETLCFNRDRVEAARLGGAQTGGLRFLEHTGVEVSFLAGPTPVRRPPRGRGLLWRVASFLALNGLTLGTRESATDGLREYLQLCDRVQSSRTLAAAQGLLEVEVRRVTGKVTERLTRGDRQELREFVARGLDATIRLNETRYSGDSLVFAGILERFLSEYCSLNSFVQSRLVTSRDDSSKDIREVFQWPRRVGTRPIL